MGGGRVGRVKRMVPGLVEGGDVARDAVFVIMEDEAVDGVCEDLEVVRARD